MATTNDRLVEPGLWRLLATYDVPGSRVRHSADVRIARAGDPLDDVYFPIDATVLIARQTPRDPVPLTVGLIGHEGLVGWPALMTITHWTHDAIVIGGGDLLSVSAATLDAACGAHPQLRGLLLRVAHNHTLQLAQSVVANLGHSAERRLARWLTMLDDRSVGEGLNVTHDQLAQLLNVRRATVTDVLHIFEGEHLIRNTRGRLQVRNRAGLEARAGQSYGLSENDYNAAIGPFGNRSTDQV